MSDQIWIDEPHRTKVVVALREQAQRYRSDACSIEDRGEAGTYPLPQWPSFVSSIRELAEESQTLADSIEKLDFQPPSPRSWAYRDDGKVWVEDPDNPEGPPLFELPCEPNIVRFATNQLIEHGWIPLAKWKPTDEVDQSPWITRVAWIGVEE